MKKNMLGVGSIIEFSFYGFGLVSQEKAKITKLTQRTIETNSGWRFDRKTGKCLNDNTEFGCFRTLTKGATNIG